MYKDPDEETGEMCPECGKPLVLKRGRYGTFTACSDYPNCKYVLKIVPKVEETGEMCPLCGKPLVKRKNKKGQEFIGCSNYPNCFYIKGKDGEPSTKKEYTEADYVKECPSCHKGHLVIKHGKKVDFLGCTNFPKCRYHEWLSKKKEENDA